MCTMLIPESRRRRSGMRYQQFLYCLLERNFAFNAPFYIIKEPTEVDSMCVNYVILNFPYFINFYMMWTNIKGIPFYNFFGYKIACLINLIT